MIKSLLVAIAVTVTACASSLRVRTDSDPMANFKKYRTFALRDGNSSGDPVLDQRIKQDLAAGFKAKGLDEVRPENADLIIVSHTATRRERTYETFYDTWGGWRWAWARPTVVVDEFRVGTLVVDVFDNQAKTAVWHGYASEALSDTPSKVAEKADRAVRKLVADYPG
ncbi:MAG TPA: DUF4136 domain-containing protein [Vicinamibacterales bacterium]|nr:DUF4136 domain-containing protein [Vicinamibacterales bacterium]